ncbi:MAG: hypothetical protein ACO1QB_18685 [Verrucomicrobiales bacterium]
MAETRKTGEEILSKVLKNALIGVGFIETEALIYIRGKAPQNWLMFPVRAEKGMGYFCSVNLGIRFEKFEPNLYPDEPGPTIFMPLHLLTLERDWTEWSFKNEAEAEALIPTFLVWLERLAEPFWEKYSIISNVKMALNSSNPADWFVLEETQRLAILAVIKFIEGDSKGAIHDLDVEVQGKRSQMPKNWLPLKRVRDRIELATNGRLAVNGVNKIR